MDVRLRQGSEGPVNLRCDQGTLVSRETSKRNVIRIPSPCEGSVSRAEARQASYVRAPARGKVCALEVREVVHLKSELEVLESNVTRFIAAGRAELDVS